MASRFFSVLAVLAMIFVAIRAPPGIPKFSDNPNKHDGKHTRTLKACRADHLCGHHGGYTYVWCYLAEKVGSQTWETCCYEPCLHRPNRGFFECKVDEGLTKLTPKYARCDPGQGFDEYHFHG